MTRSPRRAMSAYVVACLMFGLGCKPSPQPTAPVTAAQSKGDPRPSGKTVGIIGVLKPEAAKPKAVTKPDSTEISIDGANLEASK